MSIIPRKNDVLFGKGTAINSHPGNQNFRSIVDEQRPIFAAAAERKVKRRIAKTIINEIHSSGGRFLVEDRNGKHINDENESEEVDKSIHPTILLKVWVSVDMDKVTDKVLHRLREKIKVGDQQKVKAERQPSTHVPSSPIKKEGGCSEETSSQSITHKNSVVSEDLMSDEPEEQTGEEESAKDSDTSEKNNSGESADLLPLLRLAAQPSVRDMDMSSSNLKSGKLDEEVTSFLRDFSAHQEVDPLEGCQEGTLRDWIQRAKSSHSSYLGYVKSGLPIALKLTNFLIEAENDELEGEQNPIPLTSITAANVLVRAEALGGERVFLDNANGPANMQMAEVIDLVSVMSGVGDDPSAGDTSSRLVALGLILFELFAGEEPTIEGGASSTTFLVKSISLNDEDDSNFRPKKKFHFQDSHIRSNCVHRLKFLGIPYSICSLVENLLENSQGEACRDQAYSSFVDVLSDLQLMIDDPFHFLDDITVNPLPSLSIPNKLYGREDELQRLDELYQQHINGHCGGVIITGQAGVGKSRFATHVRSLAKKSSSYFLSAKFEKNPTVPLATVGSLFDDLCNLFVRDSTETQRKMLGESLQCTLGIQAALLVGILPSLTKLMPRCGKIEHSNCFDISMSLRFLIDELLREVSSYSRRIVFLIDDIQWADEVSLLLIRSLIQSQNKSVFFTISYRDGSANQNNEAFNQWMRSESALSLETIKLGNLTEHDVNQLISESLHLSPRITLPLASVLHHKAGGGNPLFLRQLIESLKEKGYIYVDLSHPKWSWAMESISELKISGDVVQLLIDEMQKLPPKLCLGLKLASCIGSSVNSSILDILGKDIGHDLQDILWQLSRKGFMENAGGSLFCFSHNCLQQAAYQMIPEQQRREYHMRCGLALYTHMLDTSSEEDELFFTAINQINLGGPDSLSLSLSQPSQRAIAASLNLKAGKRTMGLLDLNTAFHLFEQGIRFLPENHWETHYELTIDLYDAVVDAACWTHNIAAVSLYNEQLFAHARCPDDKLNGMYASIKVISSSEPVKTIESTFNMLIMLGEQQPRPMGDTSLNVDMAAINDILNNTTDSTFFSIADNNEKKFTILMNLYAILGQLVRFGQPSLVWATSLRMIEMTLNEGLCFVSPLAFAYYADVLVTIGSMDLAVRLGRVALKMSEETNYSRFKSLVYAMVYQIMPTPFQSVVEGHAAGYRAGQRIGDVFSSLVNQSMVLSTGYVAGNCVKEMRSNCRSFTLELLQQNFATTAHMALLHVQFCVLIDGLQMAKEDNIDNLPGEPTILSGTNDDIYLIGCHKVHSLLRAVLFRTFNEDNMWDLLLEEKPNPNPFELFGFFFEGLVCFEMARQESNEKEKWWSRGVSNLQKMQHWNKLCSWNFENKMTLLEAEMRDILGDFTEAERLYTCSIRSAHQHKFTHEEGVCSEIAGLFFYRQGLLAKALSFFVHSMDCYTKWGATAVSKRVEIDILRTFGLDVTELELMNGLPDSFFALEVGSSKKRQDIG